MKKNSLQTIIMTLAVLFLITSVTNGQTRQKRSKATNNRRTEKSQTVKLFNGKDLSNWAFCLKDKSVDPSSVFSAENEVIHIKGNPFGYMRTKDIYSEYKLHVEWRWPVEATNSGVFIHAQLPDTIWLQTFECQLKAGSAGDFVCMNGAKMNEKKENSAMIPKIGLSSEKPSGEWNTMEVICKSNTIEVYVNGVLKNKGTGLSANKGHICLQSEGKDIEFRNVFLTMLPQSERRK